VSWTVNQFFAVILLIWILVLFVQSLLGLFKVRLSTAQLFGLILVIGGVFGYCMFYLIAPCKTM